MMVLGVQDMVDDVKRMDIHEFRELGFLQEANRLFFHPLGLALEVFLDEDTGEERLGGVWDYRDDPEGMCFGDGVIDQEKVDCVSAELSKHVEHRVRMFGAIVQESERGYEDV